MPEQRRGCGRSWPGACLAFFLGFGAASSLLTLRWIHAWGFRIFGLPELLVETNLFSENAFYYSFYKQVVDATSLSDGIHALRADKRTEYPKEIDALSRFTLLPELALGTVFRLLAASLGEAVGGAFGFYAGSMLLFNSIGAGVLCVLAWYEAGGELACAVVTIALWVGMLIVPASRTIGVHVAALRENFALPLLHCQTALFAFLLNSSDVKRVSMTSTVMSFRHSWLRCRELSLYVIFSVWTLLLLLTWQFIGFVLCVQVAAAFGVLLLGFETTRPTLLRLLFSVAIVCLAQTAIMPGCSVILLTPLFEVLAGVALAAWLKPHAALRLRFLRGVGSLLDGAFAVAMFLALRSAKSSAKLAPLGAHVDDMFANKCQRALGLLLLQCARALDVFRLPTYATWIALTGKNLANAELAMTFDSMLYLKMDEFSSLWDDGVFERNFNSDTKIAVGVTGGACAIVLLLVFMFVLIRYCRKRFAERSAEEKRSEDEDTSAAGYTATKTDFSVGLAKSADRDKMRVGLEEGGSSLAFLTVLVVFYFALMGFVWRLRVLALPLGCVVAAQALSPGLWSQPFTLYWSRADGWRSRSGSSRSFRQARCPLVLLPAQWAFALATIFVARCYLSRLDEFYDTGLNPDTELEDRQMQYRTFSWIRTYMKSLPSGAEVVIAGDPSTLASVRLGLPSASIVAHPHFEDPDARRRFREMKEYLYACASARDAHARATKRGWTHLLLHMTSAQPGQALELSRFYKKSRMCRQGMDMLGMDRTFFQIVLGAPELFEPLRVVGSYIFVKVLATVSQNSVDHAIRGAHPGSVSSWRPLLDRCDRGGGASSRRSNLCAEAFGMLVRTMASPFRQHGWVRTFAPEAQKMYPKSAQLQSILAKVFDYDLSDFQAAVPMYQRAAELEPDEPTHLFDLASLYAQVYGQQRKHEIGQIIEKLAPLLLGAPPGPGWRDLAAQRMCQAATWSLTLGVKSRWEAALWQSAKRRARGGCIRIHWHLFEGGVPRSFIRRVSDSLLFVD